MIAPHKTQCGIADYAEHLVSDIRSHVGSCEIIEPEEYRSGIADIVHIQHQYFLYGGVAPWKNKFPRFLKRVKEPVIMTVHEFVREEGPPLIQSILRWSNRMQFHSPKLRKLICHTELDKNFLILDGVDPEKIDLIRHGIPKAMKLPDKDLSKREFGMDGRIVLTIPGFISGKKGHNFALQALSMLPEKFSLLFAGGQHPSDQSPYFAQLVANIEASGLSNRVTITGYLTESRMESALAATDVVLAPFLATSGSGSLAMAIAKSIPVIASDIIPHNELLRDTPGCLSLFEGRNVDSLKDAILALMIDSDQLNCIRLAEMEFARKHSFSEVAKETVKLYQSILGVLS